MSYKKAKDLLPIELVELIQQYVDGECIYIPRREGTKKGWGTNTSTRGELNRRNAKIYADYLSGVDLNTLSRNYHLSYKSIQRIVLTEKKRRKSL
ncbi:CD3324 family protein [Priestia koreensis]|uniref:CD3324 family protein n=1 Tax=Priestia koreensis TaxID=284581 RepID=UPI0028F7350B|nr:CD3324 family protein [Priestia koreensis]